MVVKPSRTRRFEARECEMGFRVERYDTPDLRRLVLGEDETTGHQLRVMMVGHQLSVIAVVVVHR